MGVISITQNPAILNMNNTFIFAVPLQSLSLVSLAAGLAPGWCLKKQLDGLKTFLLLFSLGDWTTSYAAFVQLSWAFSIWHPPVFMIIRDSRRRLETPPMPLNWEIVNLRTEGPLKEIWVSNGHLFPYKNLFFLWDKLVFPFWDWDIPGFICPWT